MKAVFRFMKCEALSVLLVLFSFLPLFFIGSLMDIFLTHLYAAAPNGKTALPALSAWARDAIAGHRMLPQEIMTGLWLLMVLCFIANALVSDDQAQFRIRFIYSFLFTWLLSISTASLIVLACALPFDLPLARIGEQGVVSAVVRTLLLFEIVLIIIVPVIVYIMKKRKIGEKQGAFLHK